VPFQCFRVVSELKNSNKFSFASQTSEEIVSGRYDLSPILGMDAVTNYEKTGREKNAAFVIGLSLTLKNGVIKSLIEKHTINKDDSILIQVFGESIAVITIKELESVESTSHKLFIMLNIETSKDHESLDLKIKNAKRSAKK
jgi:hypothetical protein